MNYQYFDTHAHVNINAFAEDWQEVVGRAREAGVMHTNIGTQQDTSRRAVEIAEAFEDGVYATIGLHPIHTSASYHDEKELGEDQKGFTSRGEVFDADFYRDLAKSEKVVAIGECGLDYYRQSLETQRRQEEAFIQQIELANELQLPLMLHVRDAGGNQASASGESRSAYDDTLSIIKAHAKVPGNVHFFAGTWEQAKAFFDIGYTVSFTGVITFAKDYEEVVRNAPLEMIHAETDCPYVAPVPHRGKRNEPAYVPLVYQRIAEIKGLDAEEVRTQLMENARALYLAKR